MAVGVSGRPGGNRRAVGVANGNAVSEDRPTIRRYMKALQHEAEKKELPPFFLRAVARMQLIEKIIPPWLDFDFGHALRNAVEDWDPDDFATLIGRAIVYPNEGIKFANPLDLWLFTQMGLGKKPKTTGRPPKLDKVQQMMIYDLWGTGAFTQQEVAELYGVSLRTVARIIQTIRDEKEGRRI